MESLFLTYFTEEWDISNRHTLIDIAVEAGLDRWRAEDSLNSDDGMENFKEAEGLARTHRVDGVPFFIINDEMT